MLELQRFGGIADAHLRRHAIDLHLRRYERALRHLVAAGDASFDAALDLARRHSLMRLALQLYEGDTKRRATVLEVYGEVRISINRSYLIKADSEGAGK